MGGLSLRKRLAMRYKAIMEELERDDPEAYRDISAHVHQMHRESANTRARMRAAEDRLRQLGEQVPVPRVAEPRTLAELWEIMTNKKENAS